MEVSETESEAEAEPKPKPEHGHEPGALSTNDREEELLAELRAAALNGDVGGVQLAVANGAKLDGIGSDGLSALYTAAGSGLERIVTVLLQSKASVDMRCPRTLFTPLHSAAQRGHAGVVSALLNAGA
eukprot:SAG25_NODE_940_length_4665_cov_9.337495_5_plen_127_part_01